MPDFYNDADIERFFDTEDHAVAFTFFCLHEGLHDVESRDTFLVWVDSLMFRHEFASWARTVV